MTFRCPNNLPVKRLLLIALGASAVLSACGPKPPADTAVTVSPAERTRLAPRLAVENVQRNQFDLTWNIDRERDDIIRGYNIYVSPDRSLAALTAQSDRLEKHLYRSSTYPGDTDGDIRRESITIEPVKQGVRYFVHVRTVFPNGQQSEPSSELEVIPRPRGRLALTPRYSGNRDGFSFSRDESVPGDSEANDVYMFANNDGVFLASPSRLDQALRETRFVALGPSDSLDDYPQLERPWEGEEKISVREGHSIGLILEGNHLAKLRPVEIDRSSGDTPRVVFEYVYQPVRGETRF